MGVLDWLSNLGGQASPVPPQPDQLEDFLRAWEGCKLTPYRDAAGLPTIGVGHLIQIDERFEAITQEQADHLLADDIAYAQGRVNDLAPDLTRAQNDALCSFVFNLGSKALAGSTLLRKLNVGDIQGAADEFLRWNKAHIGGVPVPVEGLTKRRIAERNIFLYAQYDGKP